MAERSVEEKSARALALLDGMADLWFAESGFAALNWPETLVRAMKQAHLEGLYVGRCSAVDELAAVPVEQWKKIADEPVLIYVVHNNAQFEKDETRRLDEWEAWYTGRWIDHNGGGFTWHGMCGRVTHVAKLPNRPEHP